MEPTGHPDRAEGNLDEEAPDATLAGVADVTGVRRPATRRADDRVEPETADELVRLAEAPDVADEGDQDGRGLEPDARDREEPPDPPIVDDRPGDPGLGEADLGLQAVEESDLGDAARSTATTTSPWTDPSIRNER